MCACDAGPEALLKARRPLCEKVGAGQCWMEDKITLRFSGGLVDQQSSPILAVLGLTQIHSEGDIENLTSWRDLPLMKGAK